MKRIFLVLSLVIVGVTVSTVMAQVNSESALLGGDNTVFDESEEAFTNPLPLLTTEQLALFEEGDEQFERVWQDDEGLGPLFNAVSCESCHLADGRGRPPTFTGETGTGLLLRLAVNQTDVNGSTLADPIYGGQFQDDALHRVSAEGSVAIRYQEVIGAYADGTTYTLYQPVYGLTNLYYGALHNQITLSPRLAGQMIGLGLLEAIPDASLLALTDPNDVNGDGISGRVNTVWDVVNNTTAIGRFGWKANQPTLLQQTAGAFNGDIGLTSSLFPEQPCTAVQVCLRPRDNRNNNHPGNNPRDNHNKPVNNPNNKPRNTRSNGNPARNLIEVDEGILNQVTFYSSTLAVPAQRNATDALVMQGQTLFETANCALCHVPTMQTGIHPTIPALSNQTIHPYTDLLLHDMGDGLADGQLNFQASGAEWRTAPLWGIGLLEKVNGYAFYLHDGRARTLEEAILWHGGEAQASRDSFISMSAEDRDALIAFLKSL